MARNQGAQTATASTSSDPANARMVYMNAAYKDNQEVPLQPVSVGGVNSFVLPHAGIGRYAVLRFIGNLTRTEGSVVGTATASPYFPYNIAANVNLTDYNGVTRVNAKGFQLYQKWINTVRNFDPSLSLQTTGVTTAIENILYNATIPAGTASTTTSAPLTFAIKVPISVHDNTTLCSYPFAVPGNTTINITTNAALGGNTIDFPVVTTGGTVIGLTGNWYVTYYYFDAPVGTPLPVADFNVIYEVVGSRITGLTAGNDVIYNLATGRTFLQLTHNLVLNGALDTVDVNKVKLMVNGNTPIIDEYLPSYLTRTLEKFGRLMPAGTFVSSMYEKPLSPNNFGSISSVLNISSSAVVGSFNYLDTLAETQYVSTNTLS